MAAQHADHQLGSGCRCGSTRSPAAPPIHPDSKAPYFIQAVRQILEDSLSEAVDRFSYTVETTLDSKLQRIAEEELDRQLAAIESGAFGRIRASGIRRHDARFSRVGEWHRLSPGRARVHGSANR